MKKFLLIFLTIFLLAPAIALAQPEGEGEAETETSSGNSGGITAPEMVIEIGGTTLDFKDFNCEPGQTCDVTWLGEYIALIYRYGVLLAAALAILMIMVGGLVWLMSAGRPDQVSKGKDYIIGALSGLFLALFSFIILSTVNSGLVKPGVLSVTRPSETTLEVADTPDIGPGTDGPSVAGGYEGYVPGERSNVHIQNFADGLNGNNDLTLIEVNTGSREATFTDSEGNRITVPVNIGTNGISVVGGGAQGDRRTPTGEFTITDDIRISDDPSQAVTTRSGDTNLGPAFVGINATDQDGNYRGVGFHGSPENGLRPTYGCIRMRNSDLILLSEHMDEGTEVVIF